MPRGTREKSESGIYHVMLRGIDKMDIFLSDSDYEKFLYYVREAMDKSDFVVYGYCLMTNHVHLLIKTETEEIGDIVRRIAVGYAQYHNLKNGRTGHLFQNRFRSETVDSDAYFLMALRYIHQNPIKAGMVENIEDYRWSSYTEYINIEKKNDMIIDPSFALSYFSDVESFMNYMGMKNEDQCLEYDEKIRYTDEELMEIISSFTDISKLKSLDTKSRNEILKMIKANTKASNRQISRITGVGRGVLEKIK
jgi:putative transposase